MAVKLLAVSDLHLGRKSAFIPGNAPEASTRCSWERIVDYAVNHTVDALLLAGDIVDQDNRYYEATGILQQGFDTLGQAGIEVFAVGGNHDYEVLPQLLRHQSSPHVHLLGINGNWETKILSKNGQKIQFAGWSFPAGSVTANPLSGFDKDKINSRLFTIGLLHGDADMTESNYGPVPLDDLVKTNIQAWVLGHVHKPQILHQNNPLIFYPGSPQALSAKETGSHGVTQLTIENDEEITIRHIPLSPVRYEHIELDVSHVSNRDDLRKTITGGIMDHSAHLDHEPGLTAYLVFDIRLAGEHTDPVRIRAWSEDEIEDYARETAGGTQLLVRKALSHVRPAVKDLAAWASDPSPVGKLAETILAIEKGETNGFIEDMVTEWKIKARELQQARVYGPLHASERLENLTEEQARQYILKESRQLLGTLLAEKEHGING
ncbi:MAG: exonuclease SbcCD subunit D [Bacteroidales bacterium]